MKHLSFFIAALLFITTLPAQKTKTYDVQSLDGNTTLHVTVGDKTTWAVDHQGQQIIAPSALSLQLQNEVLGDKAVITSSKTEKVNNTINAINYVKATIPDEYNQLTLQCKGGYGIIFRVYNDAVAYRFFTKKKDSIIVQNEEATFNFTEDYNAFIPIQWDYRDGKNFNSSFEALYHEIHLSQFPEDSLAFLPLLVDVGGGKKVAILEGDLEDYPGMYLNLNETGKGLKGVYAPYPTNAHIVGINYIPTERADYIATTTGTRNFPWRIIAIADEDKDLLNNDIVQKLASPPRLTDYSWVKPGQVAWDWWNNWNITGVDFKAGINLNTYKYYIDFAAENKIPYIVMDEGWSNDLDLLQVKSDLDLQAIIDYGKQKNVDVILWATWYAVSHQMDTAFPHYAQMGIKGFKIDFFDRDDAIAVASTYAIAKKAADYKLMVDYHGIFKPTGLNRTYPNVVGFEGVRGLENFKWANDDAPRYITSIPFIRMLAGPMDYTPGAMRNANKTNFRPINGNPMSQGTRCQQLAEYIVFYAPLQMLSDNPTTYRKEQECTDFITQIPTVWDETVPLDSKVSEYVAVARRKGDTWFVGAMNNWNAQDITLDFSFLPAGNYTAVVFKDGVNADREATDYKKEIITMASGEKKTIHLAPGGDWAARIIKQ
ncbi:glycoside hydrolase family 97 protein [Ilyomonas limi]|uniref:Glycoside hydrolase family 97 protein n=1 Tax=Ilyomonas limi TaxID=2575867 RepID=A0A4U3KS86_9BACT|nr:glycoside hydrolase family 97 protein [Ilyomonas limi]TKK65315.1 glycoside hydrolase family 97 protein [Ilyomonas limi]